MKTIFGIINFNTPQYVYYLIKNIRKVCHGEYEICIFDTGTERKITNIIDDIHVYRNTNEQYFSLNGLSYADIRKKAINTLINLVDSNHLIVLDAEQLLCNNIIEPSLVNTVAMVDAEKYAYINVDYFKENGYKSIDEVEDPEYKIIKLNKRNNYIIPNEKPFHEWLYLYQKLWKTEYLDCVVSLTTFKGRIYDETTFNVLCAIIAQQTRFNFKVVLVLSKEEFGDNFTLPDKLKYLVERHEDKFEILWTDKDTKPLKKLDPTMEKYPEIPIITMDDDDLCHKTVVEDIMIAHINDPYYAIGSLVEITTGFIKWIAGIRLFPEHCLYNFPLDDYYTYYDGILDDNFNAMRCAYKGTPVKGVGLGCKKVNQTELKLTRDYQNTPWGEYYKRFIIAHLDEIPEELYYE